MKDHQVEQLLKRAVSIVDGAEVPAELRATAFAKVWDTLSGAAVVRTTPSRRSGRSKRIQKVDEQTSGKQAKKGTGPKSLISDLAEEGFFDDWKGLPDVQVRLRVRGYNFRQQALSPALLRLTQEEALQREEQTSSDGRRQWVYRRRRS